VRTADGDIASWSLLAGIFLEAGRAQAGRRERRPSREPRARLGASKSATSASMWNGLEVLEIARYLQRLCNLSLIGTA
jgi:hypothetical protein